MPSSASGQVEVDDSAIDDGTFKIVALGDSYIAGNGGGSYFGPQTCYRSPNNWASLVRNELRKQGINAILINRACSGGVIDDVLSTKDISGRFAESCDNPYPDDLELRDATIGCRQWLLPQFNALGSDTDLVLLSIGGNDVKFSDIVKNCFAAVLRDVPTCDELLTDAEDDMEDVASRIRDLLSVIFNETDQSAQVVLVGYPPLTNRRDYSLIESYPCINTSPSYWSYPIKTCVRSVAAGSRIDDLGLESDRLVAEAVRAANDDAGIDFASYISLQDLFRGPPHRSPHPEADERNPNRWINEFLESLTVAEFYHYNMEGHRQVAAHVSATGVIQAEPTDISVEVPTAPALDLMFVVDTTASMEDEIAAVKTELTRVVDALSASTSDYRVGLVTYRDHPDEGGDDDDYVARLEAGFSSEATAIRAAIAELDAIGGGDDRETVYSGLALAFEQQWRPGVKKLAIVIGDAPAKNPEPISGLDEEMITHMSLAIDPVAIVAVDNGSLSDSLAEATETTGGFAVADVDASDIVGVIENVIDDFSSQPTAWVGQGYVGAVGVPISFSAEGSVDSDGSIVEYRWDFDSNGTYDRVTNEPTVEHAYEAEFHGLVTVAVVDDAGGAALATAPVHVDSDGDGIPSDYDTCPDRENLGQEEGEAADECADALPEPNEAIEVLSLEMPRIKLSDQQLRRTIRSSLEIEIIDVDRLVEDVVWFASPECQIDPIRVRSPSIWCNRAGQFEVVVGVYVAGVGFVEATATVEVAEISFVRLWATELGLVALVASVLAFRVGRRLSKRAPVKAVTDAR